MGAPHQRSQPRAVGLRLGRLARRRPTTKPTGSRLTHPRVREHSVPHATIERIDVVPKTAQLGTRHRGQPNESTTSGAATSRSPRSGSRASHCASSKRFNTTSVSAPLPVQTQLSLRLARAWLPIARDTGHPRPRKRRVASIGHWVWRSDGDPFGHPVQYFREQASELAAVLECA